MAIPTETLPKDPEAGMEQNQPAYFDETRKAKQLKQEQAKARQEQTEPEEAAKDNQQDQVERVYEPFPLNPEEREEEERENANDVPEADESKTEELEQNREEVIEAQLEQARQLAIKQQQSRRLQQLAALSGQEDVVELVTQEGSARTLDWATGLAPGVLVFDITGASLSALGYLNMHIVCELLGFSPMGLKLSKPKIWNYITMIVVDIGFVIYIIVIIFVFLLLVDFYQHPFRVGWEVLKDFM